MPRTYGRLTARLGVVGATARAVGALAVAPASAMSSVALISTGDGGTAGYSVKAVCSAGPGASLNLNSETRVVDGTASATSTTAGVVAVGTSISCWIRDYATGATYGPVTGGEPGAEAVAAGVINDRPTGTLMMCASANAVWSNNHTPSTYRTPGC
jgi:hypothetical protein